MESDRGYELAQAQASDIDEIMIMIEDARKLLANQGINQWQSGYPDRGDIKTDLLLGRGYFLQKRQKNLAYLCIDFEPEPAYARIQGQWLGKGDNYGLAHRLVVKSQERGRGLASIALALAEKMMRHKGASSFRIDTDSANMAMRHLLAKNGFTFCGIINIQNSEKMAFEKVF